MAAQAHWDDDERAPLRTLFSGRNEEPSFDLGMMLKNMVIEEREKLYCHIVVSPQKHRHRRSFCESEKIDDGYLVDESDTEYPESDVGSADESDTADSNEIDVACDAQLAKIVDDQVYKKFGYV